MQHLQSQLFRMFAVFSKDNKYRYLLYRLVNPAVTKRVNFIMLNPSTADQRQDDPTIRRCIGFAQAWGYRELLVTNLYALRSPSPKKLADADDPIGPLNDKFLKDTASFSDLVVAAWGALGARRGEIVTQMLCEHKLHRLGLTRNGQPRHPLYVPKDEPLKSHPTMRRRSG